MNQQIIVITGANAGIGKATALALAKKGAKIIMVCRSQERGEAARQELIKASKNEAISLELCDFSSQKSIREFGLAFRQKYPKIDVLINNAGAIFEKHSLTEDGIERTFAVNHLGYFLVTHYLLDCLRAGEAKRIVNVASLAHTFVRELDYDNLQGEKSYGLMANYGLSKLMNVYFTKVLAERLKDENITVNCLHPGTVSTNIANKGKGWFFKLYRFASPLFKKVDKGAETSIYLAVSPDVADQTGLYFEKKRSKKVSKLAQDEQHAQRIWELSKELTNIDEYGKIKD